MTRRTFVLALVSLAAVGLVKADPETDTPPKPKPDSDCPCRPAVKGGSDA